MSVHNFVSDLTLNYSFKVVEVKLNFFLHCLLKMIT